MTRERIAYPEWLGTALAVVVMFGGCQGSVPPPGGSGGSGGSGSGGTGGAPPPAPDAAVPDATPAVSEADAAPDPSPPPPPPDAAPADAAAPADGAVMNTAPGAWARAVQIALVELSQAVFIKIGDASGVVAPAMRNSKVIEGRAAYARVHLRPETGLSPRPLRGVLTLEQADGSQQLHADSKMVSGPSTTENINSTLNFLLPAEAMRPGTTLRVAVYEVGEAGGPDPATPPRFPREGSADLAVLKGPLLMDIVLLPVRGPSGPLDDSPPRRQRLERYLADVYPAQKTTIRWKDPVQTTGIISSSTAFQMLAQARRRDNASPGSYYHMLIAVEDSQDKFLGLGSSAGPLPTDAANRIAMTMVTEHQVDSQMDTISHEMGHNLGRNHAPGCGAAGTDGRFPYPNTGVGVDGFSLGELASGKDHLPNAPGPFKPKAKFKDVMGYCYPTWISDYTWNAFLERIRIVSDYTEIDGIALQQRSLQGFYQPGQKPAWAVVDGPLVPAAAAIESRRYARIHRSDGSQATVPITVSLLRSPSGPENNRRSIAVNLPDEEVASIEVLVDGERFTVDGADLDNL